MGFSMSLEGFTGSEVSSQRLRNLDDEHCLSSELLAALVFLASSSQVMLKKMLMVKMVMFGGGGGHPRASRSCPLPGPPHHHRHSRSLHLTLAVFALITMRYCSVTITIMASDSWAGAY